MNYQEIADLGDLEKAIIAKDYTRIYEIMESPNFDVNHVGRCDFSPLFLAVDCEDEKITEVFLKMGANPNWRLSAAELPTVLDWAVEKQNIKIMKLLLKYGAREVPNPDGETSIHKAAKIGNRENVKLLLDHGFNPNLPLKFSKKTAIDIAIENNHPKLAEFMKGYEFISIKPLIDTKVIDDSRYQLVFSQIGRQKNLTHNLVDRLKYFTFYSAGKFNGGAIRDAVKENNLARLSSLLKQGYLLSSNAPLELAVEKNNCKMAKLLIQHGSIITDNCYKTATNQNNTEMKEILLSSKRKQLEVLKTELGLEDKQPELCRL